MVFAALMRRAMDGNQRVYSITRSAGARGQAEKASPGLALGHAHWPRRIGRALLGASLEVCKARWTVTAT